MVLCGLDSGREHCGFLHPYKSEKTRLQEEKEGKEVTKSEDISKARHILRLNGSDV